MKKSLLLLAIPILFAGCVTYRSARPPGGGGSVTVSVSTFEPTLTPYGEWVYADNVGRVWRPAVNVVGEDFEPYQSRGHWVYTDEGWMFESDYDWGWAPFHYGRWYREPRFGWVWAPDTVWAPAWVDWRFGGGYVGWAPLPPPGITLSFSGPQYTFIEERYLVVNDFRQYRVPSHRAEAVFRTTAPVHTVTYGAIQRPVGPPVAHVASATGRQIRPVAVSAPPPGVVRPPPARRDGLSGAPQQSAPGGGRVEGTRENPRGPAAAPPGSRGAERPAMGGAVEQRAVDHGGAQAPRTFDRGEPTPGRGPDRAPQGPPARNIEREQAPAHGMDRAPAPQGGHGPDHAQQPPPARTFDRAPPPQAAPRQVERAEPVHREAPTQLQGPPPQMGSPHQGPPPQMGGAQMQAPPSGPPPQRNASPPGGGGNRRH